MGKENKSSAKPAKPKARSAEQLRLRRKITFNILVILALLIGAGVGILQLRRYVDRRLTFLPEPPHVVLKDRPAWMTDFLADQIVSSVQPTTPHSAFDRQALVNAYDILAANPWVKKVREVRRAYGKAPGDTIVIDCEYRAPAALVQWGDYYSLVDGEGVKLPEQFTLQQLKKIMFTSDGRMNIRLIQGVKHPPPSPGKKWVGEDLKAGLEMAALLFGKPSAEEILRIDVSNFAGRLDPREAQVVLLTREGTEVRWGRPPSSKDAFIEARWQRKLQYMDWLVREFKRVDGGHSWVDLRLDELHYPSSEAQSAADDGR
jgi:hypothetical protein